jgi:hypothetical protein
MVLSLRIHNIKGLSLEVLYGFNNASIKSSKNREILVKRKKVMRKKNYQERVEEICKGEREEEKNVEIERKNIS